MWLRALGGGGGGAVSSVNVCLVCLSDSLPLPCITVKNTSPVAGLGRAGLQFEKLYSVVHIHVCT